jgi:hypothetical protein
MKRWSAVVFVLSSLVATTASAAQPAASSAGTDKAISPGEVAATPEMWFYQQYMRQYQDPKAAVRKQAEFRADQRQRRIAALKWFGYSNQRPRVACDPIHGDYAPHWTSNNDWYPDRWSGVGYPWIVDGTR